MSNTRIDLAWADNSTNENGFKIEIKIGASGTYTQIATTGANVTAYSSTGLEASTQYFYRVRAFNASGNSSYSNVAGDTTLPNPPATPSGLAATSMSNSRIDLSWQDNANDEEVFIIERKATATGAYTEIATAGANMTSYSSTGLTANTKYFYRVLAYNAGGNSSYSNEASATTLPGIPKAPSSLTATTVSKNQLALTWVESSINETGFKIERKAGTAGSYAQIATVGANVTSFADSGLATNTQYFYRVRAYNAGGHSLYSNVANATTLPNPPAAPSSLTAASVNGTQIDLAWADNANNESGFKIERKTGDAGAYTEIATVDSNITSYSNIGLNPSTEYFYRVRAYNAGGNSDYSNEAEAITFSNDTNLALNKPVNASSTDSTSAPSRAVDGNDLTYWRSSPVNATTSTAWLRVELSPSAAVMIDRAVVKWNQNYFAKEYEFQVSADGTSWTTVHTHNVGALGMQEFSFAPTLARFVRLYMKKNEKSNYRIIELEVYAGSGAAKSMSHDVTQGRTIIPATVTLAQNYPNPFSANGTYGKPATTISYSLPEGMHVTLKVINIAGQEVATLANGHHDRGIYHATFNAVNLPSGVYFSVLKAGEMTQVRRMVLAK